MDNLCAVLSSEIKHEKIRVSSADIIVDLGISKEKPYYAIKYFELSDQRYHIGYGSYDLENVKKWLSEEFEVVLTEVKSEGNTCEHYIPEKDNPYPLCIGRNLEECKDCQIRADWEPEGES